MTKAPLRWLLPDPAEEAPRRQAVARIDAFWRDFSDRFAPAIEQAPRRAREEAPALGEALEKIHPDLRWELDLVGGLSLAITPESRRDLRPLARAVLARAPARPGWRFGEFRAPKGPDEAAQFLAHLGLRTIEGWRVQVEHGPHRALSIRYGVPGCEGPRDREAHVAAMAATDALLGEELSERWVGAVHVGPPCDGVPLGALLERALALRDEARSRLPAATVASFVDEAPWALLKFNPRRRSDYRGRQDLMVGKTVDVDLWRCAHGGTSFSSERFSRVGETFCYLKIDGDEGFGDRGFEDKNEAEDALHSALTEARLGCVVGGGSGLRYDYVDLALLDVAAGFEVARRVMREGKAPRRSWLLFFDEDLAAEWAGIHPKTPPPPGLAG